MLFNQYPIAKKGIKKLNLYKVTVWCEIGYYTCHRKYNKVIGSDFCNNG